MTKTKGGSMKKAKGQKHVSKKTLPKAEEKGAKNNKVANFSPASKGVKKETGKGRQTATKWTDEDKQFFKQLSVEYMSSPLGQKETVSMDGFFQVNVF